MTASGKVIAGVRTFASDVTDGFLEITHSGFALLGLSVAFVVITLTARPDLRQAGEEHLMGWLQARQEALIGTPIELGAIERATAGNPKDLPKEQAAVAYWLSKKYRVAPEPLAVLVAEAYEIGARTKLDPTLILSIMAVESSFNPFAQSSVGAQGLMQVMTRVHTDKYQNFGGHFAAFDPVSNLRVGVKVLQECIARAGSLEGGLRYYVGAANLPDDGGYAAKVLAEHFRLRQVANGRTVPLQPPAVPSAPSLLSTQAAPAIPSTSPAAAAAPTVAVSEKVALLSDSASTATP